MIKRKGFSNTESNHKEQTKTTKSKELSNFSNYPTFIANSILNNPNCSDSNVFVDKDKSEYLSSLTKSEAMEYLKNSVESHFELNECYYSECLIQNALSLINYQEILEKYHGC